MIREWTWIHFFLIHHAGPIEAPSGPILAHGLYFWHPCSSVIFIVSCWHEINNVYSVMCICFFPHLCLPSSAGCRSSQYSAVSPSARRQQKKGGFDDSLFFFFMTVEYADMWSKRKKYLENTARLMLTEKSAKYISPPPFRQIHKYTVTAITIVSKCVWQTVWRVKKIITLFANRQSIKKKSISLTNQFVWQHSDVLVNTRVWGWPVAISL